MAKSKNAGGGGSNPSPSDALRTMGDVMHPLVFVPFGGTKIAIRLRRLTQAQAYYVGGHDLTLIKTFQDKIRLKKKPGVREIVEYTRVQAGIAREAMVKPSYKEMMKVMETGLDVDAWREEMKALELKILELKGPLRTEAEEQLARLKIRYELLLPDDFLAAVTAYSLGLVDESGNIASDIDALSEDILYDLAVRAKLNNQAPSQQISGRFTDFMRADIDRRAWQVYAKRQKGASGSKKERIDFMGGR